MRGRRSFEARVVIEPAGLFGVEDGRTVLVEFKDEPSFLARVWQEVLQGRSSTSKSAGQILRVDFERGDYNGTVIDNVFHLRLVAASPGLARSGVDIFMRRFVRRLSVILGEAITYRLDELVDYDGHPCENTRYLAIPFAVYDLPSLTPLVGQATKETLTEDWILLRALDYYRFGHLYLDVRQQLFRSPRYLADAYGSFGDALIGSACLSFWKAATTILGEPGDPDMARRVMVLDLDKPEYSAGLDNLRKIRNDFDIAHRSYRELDIAVASSYVEVASKISAEVLLRYSDYIGAGGKSFPPSYEDVLLSHTDRRKELAEAASPVRARRSFTGQAAQRTEYPGR
jgi:hypothetical protein